MKRNIFTSWVNDEKSSFSYDSVTWQWFLDSSKSNWCENKSLCFISYSRIFISTNATQYDRLRKNIIARSSVMALSDVRCDLWLNKRICYTKSLAKNWTFCIGAGCDLAEPRPFITVIGYHAYCESLFVNIFNRLRWQERRQRFQFN